MKIVRKIMVYLAVLSVNFAIYVLLFSAAFGVKPAQFGGYLTEKAKAIQANIMQKAMPQPKTNADSTAVEDLHEKLKAEVDSLKQQNAQLQKQRQELELALQKNPKAQSQIIDEDKIYNLAKIYDNMDKQKVAEIFSEMPDSLVVAILPKMKPANASQVLQHMDPSRSAIISKLILVGLE